VRWKKVAIVGVGLLGGSIGLALKQRHLAERVVGLVRRAASVAECKRLGAVHEATRNLSDAVRGADLVILCTPIGQMKGLASELASAIKPGAIVTDVGSVKLQVVKDVEASTAHAGAFFIGSHPMAGGEKMGVGAARADLFKGAICVVTPTRRSNIAALQKVEGLWRLLGSRLLRLSPEAHDALVSRSSHLPHILAAELSNLVLSPNQPKEQALLCASGFRDSTRIAMGSPEMWRDIALANRENLVRSIDTFVAELNLFRRSLAKKDVRAVARFFETARDRRLKWKAKAPPLSTE